MRMRALRSAPGSCNATIHERGSVSASSVTAPCPNGKRCHGGGKYGRENSSPWKKTRQGLFGPPVPRAFLSAKNKLTSLTSLKERVGVRDLCTVGNATAKILFMFSPIFFGCLRIIWLRAMFDELIYFSFALAKFLKTLCRFYIEF